MKKVVVIKDIEMQSKEEAVVKIVDYAPEYKAAFQSLNEHWITEYFEMEDDDYKTLGEPEAIIRGGGRIFVALLDGEPVGVCALKPASIAGYDFELSKMAVSAKTRGKGIGYLLGQAVIEGARALHARKIYLEGNTSLEASIRLYRQLGFRQVPIRDSHYKRVNIQMELSLD